MATETLILNGLNISSGAFSLEALDLTPPPKKPEWAQAADADGANLVRTPLFENRTITATIRIEPQASMNLALEKLGELVDQLQEAEKNPGGIPLEWTPANSSKTITFFVLTGAVTGLPIVNEGSTAGYFAAAPLVSISMTAKPFGYGTEVEAAAAKSIETGLSIVTLTVASLAGDVPAEGRLVVKDTAAKGRRFVEWGLENRYYNASTALVLDSEDMTPVGGTQNAALTGAYKRAGATNATIKTTLVPEPTICANTGVLKHIGTFRVKARAQATLGAGSLARNVHVRLSYQDGEGALRANQWQTPVLGGSLVEVDLGTVALTPAIVGTQKWLGQIEAYSDNAPGKDVLHIDYLTFVPVLEGYGKARGRSSLAAGTMSAFDNFTTGTLSGALNARTPPLGSAWATSGAATDWTVEAGKIKRASIDASDRWSLIGSVLTNSMVTMAAAFETAIESGASPHLGLITRWVNSTNYAYLQFQKTELAMEVQLITLVGGGQAELAATRLTFGTVPLAHIALNASLVALADGSLIAEGSANGLPFALAATSAAIATGGALASGQCGIVDRNGNVAAISRSVSSIGVQSLASSTFPPYCIQPSHSLEMRSDSAIAQDSTGTYYGPVPQYRGSRFYLPQGGAPKRTSRIIVKADRNDLEESDEQTIGDAFTAQVFATPRYHVIPR